MRLFLLYVPLEGLIYIVHFIFMYACMSVIFSHLVKEMRRIVNYFNLL